MLSSKLLLNKDISYCILVKISIGKISSTSPLIYSITVRNSWLSKHFEYIFYKTSTKIIELFWTMPIQYLVLLKFYWLPGKIPNSSITNFYVIKYSINNSGLYTLFCIATSSFFLTSFRKTNLRLIQLYTSKQVYLFCLAE